MSKRTEKRFEELAERVDEEASAVKCSIEEYVEGLKTIRDRLNIALSAAEADLRARDR